MNPIKNCAVEKGVFMLDGKPMVFLSADYPYYRDSIGNWSDRIEKLKEMGCNVITFYVPWRHHQVGVKEYDFVGSMKANKDVCQFIELIHKAGLYAVVKPGPFIHAETDFGGLPDNVSGTEIGESWTNAKGNAVVWHNPLPAPMNAKFRDLAEDYFSAVNEQVVKPNLYPKGPVIALQVLNEGTYSDGQHAPTAYDYSDSAIAFYRESLAERFGSVTAFSETTGYPIEKWEDLPLPRELSLGKLASLKDIVPFMLWSENQNKTQGELYGRFSDTLEKSVPHFFNINPPLADTRGYDYWLTRVTPETMPIEYGFTNWIGVVSHDETAFLRYLLLVKRARGINLEENWGFSKLYDWRYQYHHIPFYQTVLAMALGATGFNVYTGVSTDQWDDGIDTKQQKPYPDCSPITQNGECTDKSALLKRLNRFLKEFQNVILSGKRENRTAFGVYTPYSYLSCYASEASEFSAFGQKPVRSGFKALDAFMQTQLVQNRDFTIANIEFDSVDSLMQHDTLVVVGGFFMSEAVQEKLIAYVKQGGRLLWLGELPSHDEYFNEKSVLAEVVSDAKRLSETNIGDGQIVYSPENPFESGGVSNIFAHIIEKYCGKSTLNCETAYTFMYEHDGQKLVYVLSFLTSALEHVVTIDGEQLTVNLPAKGAAIVALGESTIDGALVKGINDYDGCSVTPAVTWQGNKIEATSTSDMLYLHGEVDQWQYS